MYSYAILRKTTARSSLFTDPVCGDSRFARLSAGSRTAVCSIADCWAWPLCRDWEPTTDSVPSAPEWSYRPQPASRREPYNEAHAKRKEGAGRRPVAAGAPESLTAIHRCRDSSSGVGKCRVHYGVITSAGQNRCIACLAISGRIQACVLNGWPGNSFHSVKQKTNGAVPCGARFVLGGTFLEYELNHIKSSSRLRSKGGAS